MKLGNSAQSYTNEQCCNIEKKWDVEMMYWEFANHNRNYIQTL